MEATNTDFHAYQFKPVIKMLESPSNSLLIADEVGLGKTIEAGLIWTELRSRYNLNKLWIICPSSLCEKWRFELSSKMGISASICNAAESLDTLRDVNKRARGFAVITSMQGLRPPREWDDERSEKYKSKRAELARFLRDESINNSIIDMLIIDEAHHMRNSSTQTNNLGRLMRDVSEYLVFLSATPVHNRNDDLLALLGLLDSETFDSKYALDAILKANEPLVKARDMILESGTDVQKLKKTLEFAQDRDLLKDNQQLAQLMPLITDENISNFSKRADIAYRLETVNLLSNTITRTRKREVLEWRVTRSPDDGAIEMSEVEEEFYETITEAIREYAVQEGISEGFVLAMPQRQMTSCMAAAYRSWDNKIFDDEEFLDDDIEAGKKKKGIGELTSSIVKALKDIDVDFSELRDNDSKFEKLKQKLDEYDSRDPGQKVIIFSAFRGTLAYLKERFREEDKECIILQGGGKIPKEDIIDEFRTSADKKILLSSEVGGEGVDLQFCHIVINYDLPWNPMRLEQRIGRVDRLGQKSEKIIILNLLNKGTIDFRIHELLYEKLERIHNTFGEFEAILGKEIKKMTDIFLTRKLSKEQEEKQLEQTKQAVESKKQIEEKLEKEASHLMAHGDYILRQVAAAKDMQRWISDQDLYRYAYDFLSTHYRGSDV
ncbi:MAG: DEAD/DEAH box helicase family protein, partial [Endozoicomonadaceae bacterium]|nr:DEAD/DEAH box helicase family protein [Endozoicomonadaceae bacterium]